MTFFETFTNIVAAILVWVFAGYIFIKIIRMAYAILGSGGD